MGAHVLEQSRLHGVGKLVDRRHGLRLPEAHARAVPRGRALERLPGGDERPVRRGEEGGPRRRQAYREQYGLNTIYLLPANLYGPRDNFDLESSHVIPALIRKMVESPDEIVLWGDGTPTREFLYVEDCVEGLVLAAERYDGAEPVNLGTGVETSIRELAETRRGGDRASTARSSGTRRCRTASRGARSTPPAPRSCSASVRAHRCARGSSARSPGTAPRRLRMRSVAGRWHCSNDPSPCWPRRSSSSG